MSETKNPGEKTLSVASTKGTLTLKRGVEQGVVRQSFSHGRTKAVVVEKVKRRTIGPAEAKVAEPAADARAGARRATGKAAAPVATPASATPAPSLRPSGVVLRALSDEELDRRAHALDDARVREAEERRIAEEEARRRADAKAVNAPSVMPPKRANARRKTAAVTRKRPSARPSRKPRNGSARKRPRRSPARRRRCEPRPPSRPRTTSRPVRHAVPVPRVHRRPPSRRAPGRKNGAAGSPWSRR